MATPWMTSDQLIEAVQRKISLPLSQITFTKENILSFANEEMFINSVPSILQFHEEYFVYNVRVPLTNNTSRYSIPDRAIGMRLRDLMWSDASNNFFEMTRISADDKAFFQRNIGANQAIHKYYIEGNDVVLTPSLITGPTGNLNFFIFLRPNQLVTTDRAAIIKDFVSSITVTAPVIGDSILIGSTLLKAGTDFAIGVNDVATSANLATAINSANLGLVATNISPTSSNVVSFTYKDITISYLTNSPSSLVFPTNTFSIEFESVPSIFQNNSSIDFLQTKPGHRIYKFDVTIPNNGISGNIITFKMNDVLASISGASSGITPPLISLQVGDYICLANECIVPGIPPDLHNSLAERTAARILAAMGDQAGYQMQQQRIQEINFREGSLVDDRSEGNPKKITARHSLLRYGKTGSRKRM